MWVREVAVSRFFPPVGTPLKGNILQIKVQGDKLAGHFFALYMVRPGAETHLIFWPYPPCQAVVDGESLSQNNKELFKCPAAKRALLFTDLCVLQREKGRREAALWLWEKGELPVDMSITGLP